MPVAVVQIIQYFTTAVFELNLHLERYSVYYTTN